MLKLFLHTVVCLATTLLLASSKENEDIISVSTSFSSNINIWSSHYIDLSNHQTLGEIKTLEQERWKKTKDSNLVLPLPRTTIWAKFNILNESDQPLDLVLEFLPVFLEEISIYDQVQEKPLDQKGTLLPLQVAQAFPGLYFKAYPGKSTFYVRSTSISNTLNMNLMSQKKYVKKSALDMSAFSALIGAILSLILYHLFLYLTYQSRVYFLYVLFLISSVLFTVSFTSFHRLLLPDVIFGNNISFWWSALAAPILLFFMYLFSYQILGLGAKSAPKMLRIFANTLPAMQIANILLTFFTKNPYMLISIRFSALLQIVTLISLGIYMAKTKKNRIQYFYYSVSWIPFGAGAILIVLWLSGEINQHPLYAWSIPFGTLIQSVLLSFSAGQQLNIVTKEKLAEQNKKLELMGALEENVLRLKKRDDAITSFVSKKIVYELEQGRDPRLYQPQSVTKSIVFIDMRDYSKFSENLPVEECYEILNQYFSEINNSIYEGRGEVNKIIGDAVMCTFDNEKDCLNAVLDLRNRLSKMNRERFNAGKIPYKFGTGISHGEMLSGNFGTFDKLDRTLVGDSVNIASRIEGLTKDFAVDILCSREFYQKNREYQFVRPAGYAKLKGKDKKVLVYEIFGHHSPEVIEWKLSTANTLYKAVELELAEEYVESIRLIQGLIDLCPKHRHKDGEIMDPTLHAIVFAIKEKIAKINLKTR